MDVYDATSKRARDYGFCLLEHPWCILFLFATALALGKGGKEETNFSLFRKDPLFAITLFLGLCVGIWFSLTKNIIGWFLFPGLYFYLVILVKR